MKKLLILFLIIPLLFSCKEEREKKEAFTKNFTGKYELRKFNVKTTESTTSSAFFFLITGGYNSKTSESTTIRFYRMNGYGEYQFEEHSFEKVTIKIEKDIIIPYATYAVGRYSTIDRVIIHCRDEDFSPNININDLK